MNALHETILLIKHSDRFAGLVVAEMIKQGAGRNTMRKHEIPQSVAYWVLGSRCWTKMTAEDAAKECIRVYRKDYVFKTINL